MLTYLINLDRSPERLEFFSRQTQALGIAFERISAVDGRRLTESELASAKDSTFEFQPLNAGEIGLFLSHKLAWRQLVASGAPHAAIFEDDAVLASSLRQVMEGMDRLETPFDVIKLETTLRRVVCVREPKPLVAGHALHRLLSWHGGTAGYVISSRCAERLLRLKEKVSDPIDQVMFNPTSRFSAELNILQLTPAACIQKEILDKADSAATGASPFGTTIDRHITGGRLWRHGPLIDLRRMFKKQLERQRRRRLARETLNIQTIIPFDTVELARRAS